MFNISEETLTMKTKSPLWDAALRVVLRLWLCFSPIIRYIFDFSLRSAPHMSVKLKLCANTWRMRRKAYDAALSCLAKAEGLESTMICLSVKEKQIMELYSKSCFTIKIAVCLQANRKTRYFSHFLHLALTKTICCDFNAAFYVSSVNWLRQNPEFQWQRWKEFKIHEITMRIEGKSLFRNRRETMNTFAGCSCRNYLSRK